MASKQCPFCEEMSSPSEFFLMKHIKRVHASQPGFKITCGVDGCQRTFTTMKTYENHKSSVHHRDRHHLSEEVATHGNDTNTSELALQNASDDNVGDDLQESDNAPNEETTKRDAAVWILKTRECHKLTQTAMTGIVDEVGSLIESVMADTYFAVKDVLSKEGINAHDIPELVKIFHPPSIYASPFQGLHTQYLHQQYMKTHFNYVVRISTNYGHIKQ